MPGGGAALLHLSEFLPEFRETLSDGARLTLRDMPFSDKAILIQLHLSATSCTLVLALTACQSIHLAWHIKDDSAAHGVVSLGHHSVTAARCRDYRIQCRCSLDVLTAIQRLSGGCISLVPCKRRRGEAGMRHCGEGAAGASPAHCQQCRSGGRCHHREAPREGLRDRLQRGA